MHDESWGDQEIVAEAGEPILIGQIQVGQNFGNAPRWGGDPSLTIFPAVGQLHRDDLFLLPRSAKANFLVVGARLVEEVKIDGVAPAGWVVGQAVMVAGTSWAARRGPIGEGAHRMTGSAPFGGLACGSGPVGCNAFVGGAAVKRIDDSPPIQWPGGPPPPVRRRARPGSPEDSSRGHLVSTRRGPRGALSLAAAPA